MLWRDIKLATLKKIDPAIDSLAITRNTKDYLNAIVETTNRALNDLSTAGKFITKNITITQSNVVNILPGPLKYLEIFQHLKDDITYTGIATSYYFEVDGTATIEIYVEDVLVETIQNTSKGKFTVYKNFIPNPNLKECKIVFTGAYPYMYRNIALYNVNFENVDDIWDYVSEKRYDLRQLVPDFYRLVTTDLVMQAGFNVKRYEKTDNYYWEGDSVLVLNGLQQAEWTVHYYSYPLEVSNQTLDTYDLPLDPEVAQLIPIYNAGELLEDENIGTAQYFREQYEAGKRQLNPSQNLGQRTIFIDAQGW